MQVADGDAEPAVVGPDHVQVEACRAGDVQLGLLAGVSSLVILVSYHPGRLCNEKEMISWDSRKPADHHDNIEAFYEGDKRRRVGRAHYQNVQCSAALVRAATIARGLSVGVEMGKVQLVLIQLSCTSKPTIVSAAAASSNFTGGREPGDS